MNETIELMCAAAWNVHGKPTKPKPPEEKSAFEQMFGKGMFG